MQRVDRRSPSYLLRVLVGRARDVGEAVAPRLSWFVTWPVRNLHLLVLLMPFVALWHAQRLWADRLAACDESVLRWREWLDRVAPTAPASAGGSTVSRPPVPGGLCLFVDSVAPHGAVPVPVWSVVLIVLIGVSLWAARQMSARSRYGPVRLADVSVLGEGEVAAARARALTALVLHHCVLPEQSVPQVAPGQVGATGSPLRFDAGEAATGMIVTKAFGWLGSAFARPGWRIEVTEVVAATGASMAYRIVHLGRERVEHSGFVTGDTLERCAVSVGHEVAAWTSHLPGRTRERAVTGEYVHHLTEALGAARRRDYDLALHEARQAVLTGTTDLEARRVLGETQERLGLNLDALHTYASALVILRGDLNTWRPSGDASTVGAGSRRRDRPWWRGLESSDPAGAAILWRYVMTLRMTTSWVDRCVATTCQLDAPVSAPAGDPDRPVGEHPWFIGGLLSPIAPGNHTVELQPGLAAALALARRQRDETDAMIRSLGGFFAHRYGDLLRESHPALRYLWFVPSVHRAAPFGSEDPMPVGAWAPETWVPDPGELDARIAAAERLPPRLRHRTRPLDVGGPWAEARTSARVGAALTHALAGVQEIHRHVTGPGAGACGCTVELCTALDAIVRASVGFVPVPGTDLARLIAAVKPYSTDTAWSEGLTRPVLAQVVSRLMHQLTVEIDPPEPVSGQVVCAQLREIFDRHRHVFAGTAAAFDMHLFALHASLEETSAIIGRRSDARPQGTPALRRIVWLTVRHQYIARLHRLRIAFSGPAAHDTLADEARRCRDLTRHEVERVVRSTPWVLRTRFRTVVGRALKLPVVDSWNVDYYAACAFGVMVDPAPDGLWTDPWSARPRHRTAPARRTGAQHQRYIEWCSEHESTVDLTVQALARAVPAGQETTSGVPEWILFDDPDLDQVRRHPGFRQWAATALDVPVIDETLSEGMVALGRRATQLWRHGRHLAARNPYGTLGHDHPWGFRHRQLRLLHSHHLMLLCDEHLPVACRRILMHQVHLPRRPGTFSDAEAARAADLSALLRGARTFWIALAAYPQVFPDPAVRLTMARALRAMSGLTAPPASQFPKVHQGLEHGIGLSTIDLSRTVAQLVPEALERIEELLKTLDEGSEAPDPVSVRQVAHDLREVPSRLRGSTSSTVDRAGRVPAGP